MCEGGTPTWATSREGSTLAPINQLGQDTHIDQQEASGQQVAPGQHKAPQQVFASAVEVGELPAKES